MVWEIAAAAFLGITAGWIIHSFTTSELKIRAETAERVLDQSMIAQDSLKDSFKAVAGDVLRQSSDDLMSRAGENFDARKKGVEDMLKPLKESLSALNESNQKIEKDRAGSYQALKEQIAGLSKSSEIFASEARSLSTALSKSSNVRGDWGEVTLRNILEMSGMNKHSDFTEQFTVDDGRPDVVVHLPGGGAIPIDAKAIAGHFLKAVQADDSATRDSLLNDHARAVKEQVKALDLKAYRDKLPAKAEHVVMFLPSEALVAAAFQSDPSLHEFALQRRVLIATPTTLIALLHMAALQWQQVTFADRAQEVIDESQELYRRIATWSEHYGKVGKNLDSALKAFNDSASSWDSRIRPQIGKVEDLKIAENLPKKISNPALNERELKEPGALSDGE